SRQPSLLPNDAAPAPIYPLSLHDALPIWARGVKKAQQEMVDRFKTYAEAAKGPVIANLIHIQDEAAAAGLRQALEVAGIKFTLAGVHEIGAVVGSHVGPNTFGIYAHQEIGRAHV